MGLPPSAHSWLCHTLLWALEPSETCSLEWGGTWEDIIQGFTPSKPCFLICKVRLIVTTSQM